MLRSGWMQSCGRPELVSLGAVVAQVEPPRSRSESAIGTLFFQAVRMFQVIGGLAAGQAVQQLISMPSSTGNVTLT
jgi:hypothetical protein